MLARVQSFVLYGVEPIACEVEVNVEQTGLASSHIVGLAQAAVRESLDRVRQAIDNSGYAFKGKRLLINLAPADLKKEGPSLDLPIAIGLLLADGFIEGQRHKDYLVAGELALDGRVRKIKGGLSLALLARERKAKGVLVPIENAREAAVVDDVEVIPVATLQQAASFLTGALTIEPHVLGDEPFAASHATHNGDLDFADVRGQEAVKRAVTVACAGNHNLLMLGPPGTGKTMLANRIPGILPPLTPEESLETTRVYSAVGQLPDNVALMDRRPVRTPHHSATAQALVGGGSMPRPGEVSLAHNGVLFLDELPEFNRQTLEMLRQPLEGGEVTVNRVHASVRFPARFMLVAAMNPSAQGGGPANGKARDKYMERVSQPLLDRIDLHVEVPTVPFTELAGRRPGTDSATMRAAVARARDVQRARFGSGRQTNASMSSKQLRQFCELDDDGLKLMKAALDELGLSARAYDKVRRVARTLADIEGVERIGVGHLAEAIQYRLLDRKF